MKSLADRIIAQIDNVWNTNEEERATLRAIIAAEIAPLRDVLARPDYRPMTPLTNKNKAIKKAMRLIDGDEGEGK